MGLRIIKRAATPLLLLAGAMFLQGPVLAETSSEEGDEATKGTSAVEEIQVVGKRVKSRNERDYKVKDGKRFVTDPYGDVESILAIAAETKRRGNRKRVSTRGITMPQSYAGGVLNRYDYRFPEKCGGKKFSFYAGEGFAALGYHHGNKVILDVMAGGSPFVSPQLWGPYDQILGDKRNVSMKMMMGDGEKDGMGYLKAAYAIGMMPIMKRDNYEQFGGAYVVAVNGTLNCLVGSRGSGELKLRQAKINW